MAGVHEVEAPAGRHHRAAGGANPPGQLQRVGVAGAARGGPGVESADAAGGDEGGGRGDRFGHRLGHQSAACQGTGGGGREPVAGTARVTGAGRCGHGQRCVLTVDEQGAALGQGDGNGPRSPALSQLPGSGGYRRQSRSRTQLRLGLIGRRQPTCPAQAGLLVDEDPTPMADVRSRPARLPQGPGASPCRSRSRRSVPCRAGDGTAGGRVPGADAAAAGRRSPGGPPDGRPAHTRTFSGVEPSRRAGLHLDARRVQGGGETAFPRRSSARAVISTTSRPSPAASRAARAAPPGCADSPRSSITGAGASGAWRSVVPARSRSSKLSPTTTSGLLTAGPSAPPGRTGRRRTPRTAHGRGQDALPERWPWWPPPHRHGRRPGRQGDSGRRP